MAMSFSRPDPSSPASVADAAFNTTRRGFDQSEVRDFLRMVAAELGRLQERERFLERELRTAQQTPDLGSVQLDDQALTRLLGEETARVLTTARESAVEIRQKAEQAAAQMLSEAGVEAARVREEAEIEAARRRADAGADAEAELSMAKQQGREMVNEARAYRERVLSELARRRELAREQIEQLLHGRDRLIQTFERARLAAVDVIAELQPLGEPDEYVNLSPTTGPVPVMLPNSPRPDDMAPGEPSEETGADVVDASTAAVDDGPDADADGALAPLESGEADVTAVLEPAAEVESEAITSDGDDSGTVAPATDTFDVAADAAIGDVTDDVATGASDDTADDGTTSEATAADVLVEPAEESAAREESAASDESGVVEVGDEVQPARDDVVVDLFARLRAGTGSADAVEAADAADATDATDAETSDAPVADADDEVRHEEASVDAAADGSPFERRDAELTPLIVSSAKRLKRVLADEQNEVLDALRQRQPVRSLDALLPGVDEHRTRFASAIIDDLLVAANAGASAAGRGTALRKVDATRALAAADDVLAEWVTVPLRDRLERCIADGDGDNVGITKRVRAVYREWKTQHIDDQLDDVFRTAYGRGGYAAYEPGTALVWLADPGHEACADCNDNTLAGTVAAGESFPTGHEFAPAHLGCRCLLAPADR